MYTLLYEMSVLKASAAAGRETLSPAFYSVNTAAEKFVAEKRSPGF